jgi:hypothetical protein
MGEFCFLHAAALHLDSSMRGLETDPDAPAALLREASRAAFRNLIDVAIAEQVAFVLITGDLYDGDWQDWRTGLFFIEQAGRLAACGIPLVIVAPQGGRIEMDWQLGISHGLYKIEDVDVDGVCMALSYRSEIASMIARNGGQLEPVLAAMHQKG